MPKIRLTITADYLKDEHWTLSSAVREFVSNAIDENKIHNADMNVSIVRRKGAGPTLQVETIGRTLPKDSLLMGFTDKRGVEEAIGEKAEGYKLAFIATLMAGRKVQILTGSEIWRPSFERSEQFDREILTVSITENKTEYVPGVRVQLWPFTPEEWKMEQKKYLAFNGATIKGHSPYGQILTDKEQKGKLYVKGVYVTTMPNLERGYNLTAIDLDRDRQMVSGWEAKQHIAYINRAVGKQDDDELKHLVDLLEQPDPPDDVEDLSTWDDDLGEKVLDEWRERHPLDVPVTSLEESQKLSAWGLTSKLVSSKLSSLLVTGRDAKRVGGKDTNLETVEEVLERRQKSVKKLYSWDDLTDEEKENLLDGIEVLSMADERATFESFQVADFFSELNGLFRDGKQYIGKHVLTDFPKTVEVVLHEWAHNWGKDASLSFEQALGKLAAKSIAALIR